MLEASGRLLHKCSSLVIDFVPARGLVIVITGLESRATVLGAIPMYSKRHASLIQYSLYLFQFLGILVMPRGPALAMGPIEALTQLVQGKTAVLHLMGRGHFFSK